MRIDRLTSTAYHEAGHAILAWASGYEVQAVTIREIDTILGEVRFLPLPASKLNSMRCTIIGAGGIAAEMIHREINDALEGAYMEGHGSDREKIAAQLNRLNFPDPLATELCIHAARKYMNRDGNWQLVDEIADNLLTDGALCIAQINDFAARVPALTDHEVDAAYLKLQQYREAGIKTEEQLHASRR